MAVTKTFGDAEVSVGDDLVATVEIRRPPDNFFDADLITSLADAYFWLDDRDDARAIVLCSAGKHFCAGADLAGRSRQPNPVEGGVNSLYQQATRLFDAKTPVVAAVQGAAIGGGLGLACSADFRVAASEARFAANFAKLGFHQGFALTVTLPAIVGQQRALELLLYTGRRIGGEEAARIGLADRLAELRPSCGPPPGRWPPRSPRRRRWPCAPSGRRCAVTWPRRSGRRPTTRARSRTGCARPPTSPRGSAPVRAPPSAVRGPVSAAADQASATAFVTEVELRGLS